MDEDGNLPIHISCSTCGLHTLQVWHDRGYDFEVKSRNGKNCVFSACKFGHVDVLEKLRTFGVSLIAEKPNGQSVLLYPMCRGNTDAFLYLLRYYKEHGKLQNNPKFVKEIIQILTDISNRLLFSNWKV